MTAAATPLTSAELDQLFRLLRRALDSAGPLPMARQPVDAGYDPSTCAFFVAPLGDAVLDRAVSLFEVLREFSELESIELAYLLGAAPRELSGLVTGAIKKRAAKLGLLPPFDVDETADGTRTLWRDRDGIAARMEKALRDERARRGGLEKFRGTKYQLLEDELEARADQAVVSFTFDEIEQIIGTALPPSARIHRQWWANSKTLDGHVQAQAWINAGFGAFPNMSEETVTFRRT